MLGFSPQWLIVPAAGVIVAALFVTPGPGPVGDGAAAYTDQETDAIRRDLEARRAAVAARIAYKEELVERLIASQATLAEVSAEFLRMNEGTKAQSVLRDLYPGSGDEERAARNVIDYVRFRKLPADRNAEVMARLQREFEQTYGHPPVPAG